MGYADNYQRAARTAGDIIINCNAASLSSAYKKDSYGYYFDVYPGLHGQDISYTLYNPHETPTSPTLVKTGSANQTIAFSMQDYIMSLAKSGTPESAFDGLSSVPTLGLGAMTVSLNSSDIKLIHNPAFNDRCQWLALDLYG
jgi:carboxylesterase type B